MDLPGDAPPAGAGGGGRGGGFGGFSGGVRVLPGTYTVRLAAAGRETTRPVAVRLDLRGALDELPDRQRSAIVLRHYAGMSVADAADVLGCAEGTVKSLTSQGLAGLRQALGRNYPMEVADG